MNCLSTMNLIQQYQIFNDDTSKNVHKQFFANCSFWPKLSLINISPFSNYAKPNGKKQQYFRVAGKQILIPGSKQREPATFGWVQFAPLWQGLWWGPGAMSQWRFKEKHPLSTQCLLSNGMGEQSQNLWKIKRTIFAFINFTTFCEVSAVW